MQEARNYVLDPTKMKRDPVRISAEDTKGSSQDNGAAGRDSEDDIDVDDEEPMAYKSTTRTSSPITEPLKKKWSRQAEEFSSRESPSPSSAPQPPAAHAHNAAAAVSGNDKGEPGFFPLHPLMDRSVYEKSILSNLKQSAMLTRAT